MKYKVIIQPNAEQEIAVAYAWIADQCKRRSKNVALGRFPVVG